MSSEQMTFDLYGHAANPPLNGNNVGVTLTLSLKAETKYILRCLQAADMENWLVSAPEVASQNKILPLACNFFDLMSLMLLFFFLTTESPQAVET